MRTSFVMSECDTQMAIRGFVGLFRPELSAAIQKTRAILAAVNKDKPAVVDPNEKRRMQLQEQLLKLQVELAELEGK